MPGAAACRAKAPRLDWGSGHEGSLGAKPYWAEGRVGVSPTGTGVYAIGEYGVLRFGVSGSCRGTRTAKRARTCAIGDADEVPRQTANSQAKMRQCGKALSHRSRCCRRRAATSGRHGTRRCLAWQPERARKRLPSPRPRDTWVRCICHKGSSGSCGAFSIGLCRASEG